MSDTGSQGPDERRAGGGRPSIPRSAPSDDIKPNPILTLDDVRRRAAEGARRLAERGIFDRDVEARLEWKRLRGLDTTVEEMVLRSR